MSRDYEKDFNKSIESLCFSSDAKKRLYGRLICSDIKRSEREDHVMKKWTLPKIAAVAVATLVMTGGVAFAAGQIVSTYSGASIFDYKYDHDDTDLINTKAGIEAIMPNEFSTGFAFDKAAVLNVDGKDTDKVVMEDAVITANFSKKAAANGAELKDAHLTVTLVKPYREGADLSKVTVSGGGKLISRTATSVKFSSGDTETIMSMLPAGEYTLTEDKAPAGYEKNDETVSFTIGVDGKVTGKTEMLDDAVMMSLKVQK